MLKTLVIYDNTGYIISQGQGYIQEPTGIPFMWVEIPTGKRITKIDTTKTPNEAVFEDIPVTIEDRISALEVAMANTLGM